MGPMPTPAVAHLTRSLRADGGIVISASHNPHHDNGIKFFSAEGEKLDDATELAIEAALEQPFTHRAVRAAGQGACARATRSAATSRPARPRVPQGLRPRRHAHRDGLRATARPTSSAPLVLRELGARVDAIGVEPNGLNINDGVGSTHPEALVAHVRATGADLGIAFDGDGDRVLFVDGDGTVLRRRRPAVRARHATGSDSGRLRGPVVGTLMTNYGLEQRARRARHRLRARQGRRPLRAPAAGRARRRARRRSLRAPAVPGPRQHRRRHRQRAAGAGSAAPPRHLAARGARRPAQGAAEDRQRALAAGRASRPKRRPCRPRWPMRRRRVAGRGRAFLRPSGTEPVVRVTVEADDDALMQRHARHAGRRGARGRAVIQRRRTEIHR